MSGDIEVYAISNALNEKGSSPIQQEVCAGVVNEFREETSETGIDQKEQPTSGEISCCLKLDLKLDSISDQGIFKLEVAEDVASALGLCLLVTISISQLLLTLYVIET